MKIRKSKIERNSPIGDLPVGKVRISLKGESIESIWVAKDEDNKVMYLLNHALMFYPMPSWGMELPLQYNIDLYKYRGDTFEETDFTVCDEAYEALKEFINENDEFDCDRYLKRWVSKAIVKNIVYNKNI